MKGGIIDTNREAAIRVEAAKAREAKLRQVVGPVEYISWDEERDYFQVYGDNGTICTATDRETAILITELLRETLGRAALTDTLEAELAAAHKAIKLQKEVIDSLQEAISVN